METADSNSRVRSALQEAEARQDACVSCGRRLGGAATPVVCTRCGRACCFGAPCSRPAALGWNCIVCHVKREMDSSSGSWTDVKSEEERAKPNGQAAQNISTETFQVREFIEKLVEKIVGGPLDGVTVGKLSSHPSYMTSGKTEDTPSSAHTALSQLIDRVVLDAGALPNLAGKHGEVANGITSGTNGKSYEDILSTAILNKVIDQFQRSNGYFNDDDENINYSRTSNSYIDDDNRSGSDWSETRSDRSRSEKNEPLALKIEEHIEEVTTAYESSGDDPIGEEEVDGELHCNRRVPFPEFGVDIIDANEPPGSSDAESDSCATDVMSTQSNWEENWLFQRKKLKSARNSHHPVPVPMLVPNPSQEFRALIGGVDADDISDLSECSESVLEEAMSEAPDDYSHALELIDALNQEPDTSDEVHSEEAAESTTKSEECLSSASEIPDEALCEAVSSTDTQVTSPDSLEVDSPMSPSPSPSLVQQDRDFPVDYDQITRIDAPPVPRPRTLDIPVVDQTLDDEHPICPIAEREKAKWDNAIEMKDNPYTPENIAKRSKAKSTFYSRSKAIDQSIDFPVELETDSEPQIPQRRYGRDYYIKSAKSPTGGEPSRSTDSPVSLQSEASLEEREPSHHQIQTWNDLAHAVQIRASTRSNSERTIQLSSEEPTKKILPSVRELKKTFSEITSAKPPIPPRTAQAPIPEEERHSKKELQLPRTSEQSLRREVELDYSVVPVSAIITNLTSRSQVKPETNKNKQEEIFREVKEIRNGKPERIATHKDTSHQNKSGPSRKDSSSEEAVVFEDSGDAYKLNAPKKSNKAVKLVHSLTARSIPKDFREGLKINSQNFKGRKSATIDEVYSPTEKQSVPPLNIDLKRRKQFWEEVIAKGRP